MMPINPLAYTEQVVQSFLRYQLTANPFADPRQCSKAHSNPNTH